MERGCEAGISSYVCMELVHSYALYVIGLDTLDGVMHSPSCTLS